MERIIFSLLVFLAPTQLAHHFWPGWAHIFGIRVDYLAPTIYLTDVLMVVLFFLVIFQRTSLIRHKTYIRNLIGKYKVLVYALMLFVAANIASSASIYPALFKWIKVFEFLSLGYYVARSENFEVKGWLILPLLFSLIFFSIVGLVQIVLSGTINGPLYFLGERTFTTNTPGISLVTIGGREFLRPYSTFSHPNSLAGYVAASLFLIYFYGAKSVVKRISLLMGSIILTWSFSLGAFVAVLVGVIFTYLAKVREINFRISTKTLLLGLLIFVISFFSLDAERKRLAILAYDAFLKSPLVGVGLNNLLLTSNSLQPVHNIFLLLLSETGVIGLLIFGALVLKSLRTSIVKRRWGLVTVFLVILITGIVDHYWITLQQNQLLLSIVFGLSFRNKI